MDKESFGRLALGAIFAAMFISYYTVLETTCANTDPNEGAGELVITRGGSAEGTHQGTRFLAPLFVNAGAKLAANGTTEGTLLWVENLCDIVLDCASCPCVINPHFNSSTLREKILVYDSTTCEGAYMCGVNRLGRTFGDTGLVGLAVRRANPSSTSAPGSYQKEYRLGEYRDAKPRAGDAGIPFPHANVYQYSFAHFLHDTGLIKGGAEELRAVITPTAPNPWRSMACGYWKPFAALLMLGHAGVAEHAVSNWIGHILTSGLRMDLAQLALGTKTTAHLMMALLHHDPFWGFHWGVFPMGGFSVFIIGSIVLTCSSTILLAAFW